MPAGSESTVARVQTSAADDRQRISAFKLVKHVDQASRHMFSYSKRGADIISSNRIYRETADL